MNWMGSRTNYANIIKLYTPRKALDRSFRLRPCTDSASLVNARGDVVTVAVYLDVFTPKSSHISCFINFIVLKPAPNHFSFHSQLPPPFSFLFFQISSFG